EALDGSALGSFDIIPFIGVSAAVLDGTDPTLVHVTPSIALTSGNTYSLLSSGAEDLAGNAAAAASTDFTWVVPAVAGFRDVVINELMADPSPTVGLPDAEFVELYNPGTAAYDLAGWTFTDGSTTATLPAFVLGPGAFCIVVDDALASLFSAFPNVVVVNTFPSMNNDGDPLELRSAGNTLIDAVTYDLTWYQDAAKALGGWTLEQVDPTTPCSSASNWRASNAAAGGTPSAPNSVFAIVPDNTAPALLSVLVSNATTIELVFSEAMDMGGLGAGTYTIDPAIAVGSAVPNGADRVVLTLAQPLVVGQLYTITVTGVSDCPGNAIGTVNTASFALPEAVQPGDVVINEVLYDPRGSGSDFVELYNRSSRVLSLAGWKLANMSDGVVGSPITITGASVLLLPGQYILLTEDPANIVAEYPQSQVDRFLVADLPSYNNGEGSVVLQDPGGVQLDRFDYTDDLHFTLLNTTEGVSLERIDPDRPTSDESNWHSAAADAGYATPGFQNSQYSPVTGDGGELSADPAIFSPDNDGYQDVLNLSYRFEEAGYVGTMIVFDLAGRESRKLMDNVLLGTSGAVSWDGILDTGDKARIGPYVVYFEVYDLSGNVKKFRTTVTLAHRL
ncbi:MAG: lamin tail domain-containing protein, partial [Flavobacteriales bacterium]|nr:lamin tail domain-containing protein [Flavobacteriales bacterium]